MQLKYESNMDSNKQNNRNLCRYIVAFNTNPAMKDFSCSSFDNLGDIPNVKLLLYLVFSYILNNEVSLLALLLRDINFLSTCHVTIADIRDIEDNYLNGTLSNWGLKRETISKQRQYSSTLIEQCFAIEARINATEFAFFPKESINLLILACLKNNIEVFDLLTDAIPAINENIVQAVICEPCCSLNVVKLIISKSVLHENITSTGETIKQEKTVLIGHFLESAICAYSKCDEDHKLTLLEKINAVIATTYDIIYINDTGINIILRDVFDQAMKMTISEKSSKLVRLILGYIEKSRVESDNQIRSDIDNFLLQMLAHAQHQKAYYIFHILFTYIKNIPTCAHRLSEGTENACQMDLFMVHYVLRHGDDSRFADYRMRKRCSHCFKANQSLCLWLQLCYIKNKEEFSMERPIISEIIIHCKEKPEFTVLFCTLLIKLGFNVDSSNTSYFITIGSNLKILHPPIFCAIQVNNINLVRCLILHSCDLEKATQMEVHSRQNSNALKTVAEYAFGYSQFETLKVLLLCGAKVSPFLKLRIDRLVPYHYNTCQDEKKRKFIRWLREWIHQPRSLQIICRNAIRQQCGRRLNDALKHIAYPRYLTDFLNTTILE